MSKLTLALAAGVLLLAGNAYAADPFTLSSSSFKDGTLLPRRWPATTRPIRTASARTSRRSCSWTNAPAGTVSYALIMTDPEGRDGLGVDHWHAYGIPASVTSFAEGETSKPSDKYHRRQRHGRSETIYMGPCTPPGAPHHYTFILVATDLDPKALPAGLTRLELLEKLNGHVKGAAGMVGLFKNPY